MTGNDRAHVERLAALLRPVHLLDFVTHVCQWLQDAHDAAADLQPLRRNNHRGAWSNNTSFGTDRYEYLLRTAESLSGDITGLDADPAFQSVLLKLEQVGVYQFNAPTGPHGSLGDISELRRELLAPQEDEALISRREAWLDGRELLLLPWAGAEESGLTDVWAGQGTLTDGHIAWDWLVRLQDVAAGRPGVPAPWTTSPLGPTLFDESPPDLALRPRPAQRPASAG